MAQNTDLEAMVMLEVEVVLGRGEKKETIRERVLSCDWERWLRDCWRDFLREEDFEVGGVRKTRIRRVDEK